MAEVSLRDVAVGFGEEDVLRGVNLCAPDGKYTVLVGPSGCGKSILLRAVAGLETPRCGEIYIGSQKVTTVNSSDRNVAMVFQRFALYRHMTVYENLSFSMVVARKTKQEIDKKVREVAELLHIADLLDRLPDRLSGGQRQRVALGRALVREPAVFLFDEPLGALDAKLRAEMIVELKRIQQDFGVTTIHVTHDQMEAQALGDYIAVMRQGIIEQFGTPSDVYDNPANRFVAGFIGSPPMNFLDALIDADLPGGLRITAADEWIGLPGTLYGSLHDALKGSACNGRVVIGIRPEHVRVFREKKDNAIACVLQVVEPYSDELLLDLGLGGRNGHSLKCRVYRSQVAFEPRVGDAVWVELPWNKIHFFDHQSGQRLESRGPDAERG
ncbi:MAG: ABC transporter ATP-binding protein [Firmicutes bacterium]|nr:ABC transporter ATP-binding protein [Bacillota bacterium]